MQRQTIIVLSSVLALTVAGAVGSNLLLSGESTNESGGELTESKATDSSEHALVEDGVHKADTDDNFDTDDKPNEASAAGKPTEVSAATRQAYQQYQSQRPGASMSLEEYAEAVKSDDLMTKKDGEPSPELPELENKGDREIISINRPRIATLTPGSEVTINVPQANREYTVVVNDLTRHSSGNITAKGSLKNRRKDYRATITQGSEHTNMALATPSGHYTVQGFGDEGWIMTTGSNADLSDDAVQPPNARE